MNKYLIKIASTRLIREIGKGAVSMTKDLKNHLVRSGQMRSGKTYIDGMDKGTAAIAKKHDIPIQHIDNDHPLGSTIAGMGGGASFSPNTALNISKPSVFLHKDMGKHFSPFEQRVIHRHELNEAKGMQRDIKKTGNGDRLINIAPHIDHAPTGAHNNLGILAHESNDLGKLPHMYVGSGNNRLLRSARVSSGESHILKSITGKGYGVDSFKGRDVKKLVKDKGSLRESDRDYFKSHLPPEHHQAVDDALGKLKSLHLADRYK